MTLAAVSAPSRAGIAPHFIAGAGIASAIALVALLSLVWTPYGGASLPPLSEADAAHWLGVDAAGRDTVAVLMSATLTTLLLSALGTLVSLLIGLPIGIALAMAVGAARPPHSLAMFPVALLIGTMISGLSAPGYSTIVLGTVIPGTVVVAACARAVLTPLWRQDFVTSARLAGLSSVSAAQRHVLPQALPGLAAIAFELFAAAILVEASISFAGLGVVAPSTSLGVMLREAQQFIMLRPLLVVAPGAIASILALALVVAAGGLRGKPA